MTERSTWSLPALSWRMLLRDWRAGELTLLAVAMVLAVASLSAVALLADRVERGLAFESHQLLGGDLLLSADHPWSAAVRQQAFGEGLQLADSASLVSMVADAAGARLVEVKAVSGNFPLRGRLRIAPAVGLPDQVTEGVPGVGEAWPDERLANELVSTGGSVKVGQRELKSSAILVHDPERGFNAFALAPRLMINLADLADTGLVQPGSRIAWRLHVAGDKPAVDRFRAWIAPRLGRGERLETLDNARPEVRTVLERAGRFLRLASLLTVVLAAAAIALAADRYLRRHLDGCAVMRCLGATEWRIVAIHGGEFMLLGVATMVAGSLAGYALQEALQWLLSGLIGSRLPAPGWQPWLLGFAVGLVLLAGFILPPLLRLRRVSPLRVLRREWTQGSGRTGGLYLLGGSALAALMFAIADDRRLGGLVVTGFAMALVVYAVVARVLLAGMAVIAGGSGSWRIGLANLRRRWRTTLIQAVALALGLTTLLVLTLARQDLMSNWRSRVPADAPNRFVINLQPEQREAFNAFFVANGLPSPLVLPMVRGRLTAVNGKPVEVQAFAEERARRLVEREFNLSWASELPAGNAVVAGRWHGVDVSPQFSVEQGLAETLGLKLGDHLSYIVAGQSLEGAITSLRKLDWDSMRVNFFVMSPPGMLDSYPVSYITAFHLPIEKTSVTPALVREFPNLTLIDVTALLRQVQVTIDEVARAVQALFGLAVVAGLVVLLAAVQASSDERCRELSLMRALGARSAQLRSAVMAEFALLGAVAGTLGGLGAASLAWALARFVFGLDYVPGLALPVTGTLVGVVGVVISGLLATRTARTTSVSAGLRMWS